MSHSHTREIGSPQRDPNNLVRKLKEATLISKREKKKGFQSRDYIVYIFNLGIFSPAQKSYMYTFTEGIENTCHRLYHASITNRTSLRKVLLLSFCSR